MKLPKLNTPVMATVQHWYTKGTREAELIHVDESDVVWRFCDDRSELSYDWDVINWKYLKNKTPKKGKIKMARKKKLPIVRRVKLEGFIRRLGDQIFTVDFTKQDGTKRIMNARRKVKSQVKPKTNRKRRSPNGVHTPSIIVYDMQKRAYRQINLETVTGIRAAGMKFKVV